MGSQKYSPEFRAEAVRLVIEYARPVSVVAEELGISRGSLHRWLKQAQKEHTAVKETKGEEVTEECNRLRKEVAELKKLLSLKEQETVFLKKAASFFAAETSPVNPNRPTGTR